VDSREADGGVRRSVDFDQDSELSNSTFRGQRHAKNAILLRHRETTRVQYAWKIRSLNAAIRQHRRDGCPKWLSCFSNDLLSRAYHERTDGRMDSRRMTSIELNHSLPTAHLHPLTAPGSIRGRLRPSAPQIQNWVCIAERNAQTRESKCHSCSSNRDKNGRATNGNGIQPGRHNA
jgi:hypothetical protein